MSEQQIMPVETLAIAESDPLITWLDPVRFKQIETVAEKLARSSLVPRDFQGKPNDCFIAVQLAARLHADPFLLMQNMFVLYGKPCLSAQFKIAAVEASNRFKTPIQYETGSDEKQGSWCRAFATTHDGTTVKGPIVSMKIAKDDGWYDRKDKHGNYTSKWRTMPGLMLMYRSADWFIRIYGGNTLFGLPSVEEVFDRGEVIEGELVETTVPKGLQDVAMPNSPPPDAAPPAEQPKAEAPAMLQLHDKTRITLPAMMSLEVKGLSTEEQKLMRQMARSTPEQLDTALEYVKETPAAPHYDLFAAVASLVREKIGG